MPTLTFLIDNAPHPEDEKLLFEHGFSVHISGEGVQLLCDTGASCQYAENARRLGISLEALNFAVLSHAHNDHTGGLSHLLSQTTIPIYLAPQIFDSSYFSMRRGVKRDLSTPQRLRSLYDERFMYVESSCWLTADIAFVFPDEETYATPSANSSLFSEQAGVESPDVFLHERALVLNTSKGLVIISPCSHRGALNVIESCRRFTQIQSVVAFVGGLHFPDHEAVEAEVESFLNGCAAVAPNAVFYTGHCTGARAKRLLANTSFVKFFYTGMRLVF